MDRSAVPLLALLAFLSALVIITLAVARRIRSSQRRRRYSGRAHRRRDPLDRRPVVL